MKEIKRKKNDNHNKQETNREQGKTKPKKKNE